MKTAASAKSVSTVTDQEARYERQGEWLRAKLDRLGEYEVVLIDLL